MHLTDFPVSDRVAIDEELSRDMAAVLEVVALGRSARSEANVKVRQPLPKMLLYARERSFYDAAVRVAGPRAR